MREIKFRAWDEELKKMYSGDEIEGEDNLDAWLSYGELAIYRIDDGEYIQLKPLQYTGIIDAHGNEIYEGDIVYQEFHDRIDEGDGFTGVVKQEEGAWWIDNEVDNGTRLWSEINLNRIKGNRFENPELLKNLTK
ncbi:YopX family protein [Bacillus cereus]|uniref:YopX family protein n=1 Tax=Bacillus cereus group TaxID=86661 RepID=UPI0005394AC2|nr:YopX family protein [Bacillus cereus]ALL20644.1 hypothetical protein BTXL6_03915 [Bacillus thuringiensis]MDZ4533935.1 YopX family protein [Bacillus cereus]